MNSRLALGLIATTFVLISARRFDSAKVFRAKPRNEKQVSFMKHLASTIRLDFWYPDSALHIISQRVVDFHVSADQSTTVQTLMEKNEIQYEILFQNLQEDIEKQLDSDRNSTDKHSYTKYNEWHKVQDKMSELKKEYYLIKKFPLVGSRGTLSQFSLVVCCPGISAWTARIAKKNPQLVSRIHIGSTFEERPIYLLKLHSYVVVQLEALGSQALHSLELDIPRSLMVMYDIITGHPEMPQGCRAAAKRVGKENGRNKVIFIDCGMHAREWISPAFCQWFLKEATSSYGKDKNMTNMLDNMNFFILPLVNVDGYIWSWSQDRMWRKNRSNTSHSDCVGVDLNRNFDVAWGSVDASHDPCQEIYCGPSAESEQETKVVTTFLRSHLSSIKAYMTIHSYSQMLLFPYGYTSEKTPNHDELNELAKGAVKAISSLYGKEYKYGTSAAILYPSSGGSDDWAYTQGIKYSFTFELRDTGKYGFLLPESQIKATCKEIMLAVKFIANYILSHTL